MPPGSISQFIRAYRDHRDEAAAQHLFERYFMPVCQAVRATLGPHRKMPADSDDVALEALAAIFESIARDDDGRIATRADLERLLFSIARRRAVTLLRYTGARLRRDPRTDDSVAPVPVAVVPRAASLDEALSREVGPEASAVLAEQLERLLNVLVDEHPQGSDVLRRVAEWKLAGYSNQEIADLLRCGLRTVERRLNDIREIWEVLAPHCRDGIPPFRTD
jgi:DNA-directed RNA polymerase specialized sigma24 family protein